ncbi:MAG: hypothetical protein KC729_07260 [Candidatus Eisenbacteria bacterium]|uniref:Uncharacterized protein n=1 Tax=Eiseniibacteriota bacterium TaxID=2212470 RepID=A0A956LXT8_UNCEI|nr:hypothetical protein [Candidatus Eisenbacteria bacterium]
MIEPDVSFCARPHVGRSRRLSYPSWTGRAALVLLFVAALGSVAQIAQATPRWAARYQQNCNLCHANPTGGGKRSAYAAQYLIPSEMTVMDWPEELADRLDPQVTPAFSVGADLRTLYLYSPDVPYRQDFFQMQATFYALLEVHPRFSLYLAQGQSQTREAYGLGYILPENGYVRVGRFTPSYGWKFDDHTMFVRERLGFLPPGHTDVGFEAAIYPKDAGIQVAVTNGAGGSIQDTDDRVAGFARADIRHRVLGAAVTVGGSFGYSEPFSGVRRQMGPFASVGIGPFTWVGEADILRRPNLNGADALVTSHEVTAELRRGIWARLTYDFYDPDIDLESGALSRYGVGLDSLIYPFLGVQAMAIWYRLDEGPGVVGEAEYFQPRIMVHFLY